MPKVHTIGRCRVIIYTNDHRPSHVHVEGDGGEAQFYLNCPDGPPKLRANYGFKRSDLTWIENELAEVLSHLCAKWREVHGDY